MDDRGIIDQLRAHGDLLDDDPTGADVDALVHGALVRGRRRRARRRVAGGLAGAVAAGLAVVVLSLGGPAELEGLVRNPPVAGTPAPPPTSPDPDATRRPSSTPTPTAVTGRVSGSPDDVRQTLIELLPGSLEVIKSSAAREEGGNGFDWEHNAAITVRDAKGAAYLSGGIGNGLYSDGCFNLENCETTSLPNRGTVWITSSPPGDKTGVDRTFNYNRPDGSHVWLMERNYLSGNAPVSRSGLPLSDSAGRALVTSARWDALLQG